ncbi:MAG: MerR family transcriptional regulator [Chitinophagales bacterium]|jgi:DNA-binding transcriptional MerR regulator|nr:MerR family transcriptional regulator [Chitinophagales bacterium]
MLEEDKYYYSIGEVADHLQTNISQIRYWSSEFDLNLRKNRKGDRLFTKEDIDKLIEIHRLLKKEGYTIEGAKRYFQQNMLNPSSIPIPKISIEPTTIPIIEPNIPEKLLFSDNLQDIPEENPSKIPLSTNSDVNKLMLLNKLKEIKFGLIQLKNEIENS